MTEILITVARPQGKITESDLYRATRSIRMNSTELAVLPQANPAEMQVQFYSRSKDRAWDAYHDFRKAYSSRIFQLIEKTPKRTRQYFNRDR
jgi:hypothetical protein